MREEKAVKIALEDWYDLCDEFLKDDGVCLSWTMGYMGCDFHDGESLQINRDFLKKLNALLQKKMDGKDGV